MEDQAAFALSFRSFRREQSKVWDVFKKINKNGKIKAFCTLCEKRLAYNGVTTSNLREHLEWHKKTDRGAEPEGGTRNQATGDLGHACVTQPTSSLPVPKGRELLTCRQSGAGEMDVR